jgi:hypothetical protein
LTVEVRRTARFFGNVQQTTNNPSPAVRYTLILTLTLALCFAAQGFVLHRSGGAPKGESNYFSSLGRLQSGARGNPEVMVLGSSITGRLPDRAHGFTGWANMGCDGGSAVDALRAMDAGILPAAPLLVIEANTLHMPLEPSVGIGDSIRGSWFQLGIRIPAIASDARPASFLYSKLLARKIGGFGTANSDEDLEVATRPEIVSGNFPIELNPAQEALVEEVRGILERLHDRGSRAVIVWLPPARTGGDFLMELTREMARRSGVPYWDLGQQAAPGTVELTDGVHMAPASAARTMRSLGNITR